MSIFSFKPIRIINPRTGKPRIVSAEEQEMMLVRGILFDTPLLDEKAPKTNAVSSVQTKKPHD